MTSKFIKVALHVYLCPVRKRKKFAILLICTVSLAVDRSNFQCKRQTPALRSTVKCEAYTFFFVFFEILI